MASGDQWAVFGEDLGEDDEEQGLSWSFGGAPSAAQLEAESADVFAGRYELLEVLGRGAFGVVHRARDVASGQLVALKVLEQALESEARQRFARPFTSERAPASTWTAGWSWRWPTWSEPSSSTPNGGSRSKPPGSQERSPIAPATWRDEPRPRAEGPDSSREIRMRVSWNGARGDCPGARTLSPRASTAQRTLRLSH